MKDISRIKHSFSGKITTGAVTAIAALAFSAVSLQVVAVGEELKDNQPFYSEFKTLDINSDNKLSRDETLKDKHIAGHFDNADINKDGVLIADEYANFKSGEQQKQLEGSVDDAAVTAKVKEELIKDTEMKGIDISVETYKGKVVLRGYVANGEQLLRAVHLASGVPGVQSVKNALVIRG